MSVTYEANFKKRVRVLNNGTNCDDYFLTY